MSNVYICVICTNASVPSLHIWMHLDIHVLSIFVFIIVCMCRCLWVRKVDGCYLTDIGADASLPETLTAELHCHLTAHSVLLTDLLKSFLPNNQPVNYWSTGAQPTGTVRILKTPPSRPPFFLLCSTKQIGTCNKMKHTDTHRVEQRTEATGEVTALLVLANWGTAMGQHGCGCREADTGASVPVTTSQGTWLPIRTPTQSLEVPLWAAAEGHTHCINIYLHIALFQPYRI